MIALIGEQLENPASSTEYHRARRYLGTGDTTNERSSR